MERYENRVLCRDSFKKLHILPLKSQYLLSLLIFVAQNKNLLQQILKVTIWKLGMVITCILHRLI
jgi:hypothetical protein